MGSAYAFVGALLGAALGWAGRMAWERTHPRAVIHRTVLARWESSTVKPIPRFVDWDADPTFDPSTPEPLEEA